MTALVAGLVWALLAATVVALIVTLAIAGVVRMQRPSAATRCLLWFVALTSAAVGPFAIVAGMTVRGAAAPIAIVRPSNREDVLTTSARHGARPETAPEAATSGPTGLLQAFDASRRAVARAPRITQPVALGFLTAWLGGAFAGLAGLGISIARVRALKARSNPLDGDLADELPWLTETAGREIYLRLSYEIETPIAVGFRRPVILIPTDVATTAGLAAIEPLVMHEYAHLTRYDDWSNLAQRILERVMWFNPLVWYVGRRIALEREVAADDAVIARTNDPKHYATTLWRLAREMRMPEHVVVAPGAMLTRKQISVRIERILDDSRAHRHHFGAAFGIVAGAACTVAVCAAAAPPVALGPVGVPPRIVAQATSVPSPVPLATRAPVKPAAPHVAAARPLPTACPKPVAHVRRAVLLGRHELPEGKLSRATVAACTSCDFSDRDLSGLDLHGLSFVGTEFSGADLAAANLSGARMTGVDLAGADFRGADLRSARIAGAKMDGTNLAGAQMTGTRFVGITSPDEGRIGDVVSIRAMNGCMGCNLQRVDLHGQDLHGLHFDGSNLAGADLHGANLRAASLTGANLEAANLDGADLSNAHLTGTNLSSASTRGTAFTDAHLTGASLP